MIHNQRFALGSLALSGYTATPLNSIQSDIAIIDEHDARRN